MSTRTLNIPPKIYAIVGREANIYFDYLTDGELGDFDWDVTCDQGLQQDERWTTSGLTATAGTYPLTISAIPKGGLAPLPTATTSLIVKAAATGNGITRKVLLIGDSLTSGGETTSELLTIAGGAGALGLTLIGTKGSDTNLHEGIAGWTYNLFYTDATSPFMGEAPVVFNFSYYMSDNGFALTTGDWVIFHLGINDFINRANNTVIDSVFATTLTQIEAMITNIHSYAAGIRIGIALSTFPSYSQDGAGANYGCGLSRGQAKRRLYYAYKKFIAAFSGREVSDKIYLVPLGHALDGRHNMIYDSAKACNARTSETMVRLANLGHPGADGYEQIADALWAFLLGQET